MKGWIKEMMNVKDMEIMNEWIDECKGWRYDEWMDWWMSLMWNIWITWICSQWMDSAFSHSCQTKFQPPPPPL